MIKWLFIIVLIGSLPTIAFSATSIIPHSQTITFIWFYQTHGGISTLIYVAGLGIFGANVIQFSNVTSLF